MSQPVFLFTDRDLMGMESSAENNQVGRRRIQHWQVISALLVVYDAIVVNAAYFGALWLRFDCQFSRISEIYYGSWLRFAPIYTVCCLILFTRMRLYNSVWRFASYTELIRVVIASVISAVVHTAGITLWLRRMPMTYYVFGALLQFVLVISVRFSYRLVLLLAEGRKKQPNGLPPKRVMLIGAGSAGRLILRDINAAKEVVERVVCIIDDEPNKWHRFIDGIPVVGGRETILENVEKFQIEKIYLAIPSATAAERRDILNICQETDCELKNLPGMYQLILDQVTVSAMKDVSVEDLLGREPIRADIPLLMGRQSWSRAAVDPSAVSSAGRSLLTIPGI